MSTKASSFSAPTHTMALLHGFASPAYTKAGGIPLFMDVLSRDYTGSDFWRMKDNGDINTKWGIVVGNVGQGKSAAMKILIMRLLCASAGFNNLRAWINDYKSEANESEYSKLSKVTQSVVFRMAEMSVNPFESRLFLDKDKKVNYLGLFNMGELLAEFGKKSQLTSVESVGLTIVLSIMFNMSEEYWAPDLIEKLSRSITKEQITSYYRTIDNSLIKKLRARAAEHSGTKLAEDSLRQAMQYANAADNYSIEEIQNAAVQVSFYYHNILHGKNGMIFGSSHSMYDLYVQKTVTRDWRGLDPDAETLLRIIDNIIQMTAIDNNRTDLLPHLNADDEMHRPMDVFAYAKSTAYKSEIARSTFTVNLSATHRLASIRKGAVGSELYRYGDTIINNLGFGLIGKQQNDPVVLNELADRFRLTKANKNALPGLPPRHFVYVLGDKERPRLVRTFATPSEIEVLPTNQANDYVLDRPNPYNERDIVRYAEENGFALQPLGSGGVS